MSWRAASVRFILLASVGVLGLLYGVMGPGIEGSDDLAYARLAHSVVAGTYVLAAGPFDNRFGVFLPTAVSYALFGVSGYSTTVWPLLCAAITLVVAVLLAHRVAGPVVAVIAAVMLVFNPMQLRQTTVLMPDLTVGMFSFVAVICLWEARQASRARQRRSCAVAFSACVAAAILTKETGLWVVYFMFVVLVVDVLAGRHADAWVWILGSGTLAAGAFFLFYHVATGEILYRLRVVEEGHNVSLLSYASGRAGSLAERLTTGPFDLLVWERGLFVLLAVALPAVGGFAGRSSREDAAARYFAAYALAVILSFWFGTTSLRTYNPLPLHAPRMLSPAVPALVIAAAVVVYRLYFDDALTPRRRVTLALVPAGVLVLGAIYSYVRWDNIATLYLLAGALFGVPVWSSGPYGPKMRTLRRTACVLFLLLVVYSGVSRVARGELGESSNQRGERLVIQYLLTRLPEGASVIASERSTLLIEYYNGFRPVARPALRAWNRAMPEPRADRAGRFVYFNDYRDRWIAAAYGDASFVTFVDDHGASWQLVTQSGVASLYEMTREAAMSETSPASPR